MWKHFHKYGLGAALLAGITALGLTEAPAQSIAPHSGPHLGTRASNIDLGLTHVGFVEDLANAVSGYPAASVTLAIVDVATQAGPAGAAVNVNEIWRFQVRIRNNGHLNMTGVHLHIAGQNGAKVSTSLGGPWFDFITTGPLTVNAHSSQDTVDLVFKAGVVQPLGTALVRAHISTFDVNFDHILKSHSGHADPPSGSFTAQVLP